ncbi:MAG: flagellar hook-associated protein FlgL [Oscillospiraceae bacterium]|nr:flagellar hook-associated protein FlgL [Oscillospiraceae bacterium]
MPYRVTNSMMVANYNRNQNAAQMRMDKFQTQLATQKKIARLSDDPVNIVKSLNARSRLYDVEQYRKNIDDAKAWLTQTESALIELNEIIKRGYDLAVQAANDVYSDDERTALSYEIRQLRDQIATLANTTIGDKYVFGGYNVSSSPFTFNPNEDFITYTVSQDKLITVDSSGVVMYNYDQYQFDLYDDDYTEFIEPDPDNPKQHIGYEINIGLLFDVSISGADFMGYGKYDLPIINDGEKDTIEGVSGNVYITFNELFTVLNAFTELNVTDRDRAEILHKNLQPFVLRLQEMQKNTLTQLSEVGGRISRLDLMADRYSKDEINYTQMKSDVEDLDLAEALMWFSMTESVYRASLGVGGRILPPSLIDFLR